MARNNPNIGYRVWDAKDSLFTTTKTDDEVVIPSSSIANNVSQSYLAVFFRFVVVAHRVTSAILLLVAGSYWMNEAHQLRMPEVTDNPVLFGHQAWVLFFVAVLLDLIYSSILTLGALGSVFLPSASSVNPKGLAGTVWSYLNKDALISIYAEMGSWADIFRYVVQMATSIVILIASIDAMNLHNVFGDCTPIKYEPGDVSWFAALNGSIPVVTSSVPLTDRTVTYTDIYLYTSMAAAFEAQHATISHFYRHTRMANTTDELFQVHLSTGSMPIGTVMPGKDSSSYIMGAGSCTATSTKGGVPYYTSVMTIAVALLIRFLLNTFALWCIFAADRPYYILPYTCAGQRKRMGERIQKRYQATTDSVERKAIKVASDSTVSLNDRLVAAANVNPQVPVVPVQGMQDADPESVQAMIVPELSKSMTCNGWIEPFWYNILGSLRMHEYVAYVLYIFAFYILAVALSTPIKDAIYMPQASKDVVMQMPMAAVNNQPPTYRNYFMSATDTCTFFYNPNEPKTALYASSIYTPAMDWDHTTHKLTNFFMPALYACELGGGATWSEAFSYGGAFGSGCCAKDKKPAADSNVFDSKGEQTNPMYIFAILVFLGSVFYLISSLAYAAAIFGLNQAPIPQVTLNSADPGLFES